MKVNAEDINKRITDTRYIYDGTLTLCIIELDNGFKALGESACVDPAEYNKELGETMARARAFSKLWAYFGFKLAEDTYAAPPPKNMRAGDWIKREFGAGDNPNEPKAYGATANATGLNGELDLAPAAVIPSSLRAHAEEKSGSFADSLRHPDER